MGKQKTVKTVGFFGNGVIARNIFDFFVGTGWTFDRLYLYDQVADYAQHFAAHMQMAGYADIEICTRSEDLIQACDLIIFATTALQPHVVDPALFAHNPIVLHISLRDLAPEIILAADNIVDDVNHCLTANTSPHLAEQQVRHHDFIAGTTGALLDAQITLRGDRPVILSPFGMGLLDVALGKYIFDVAATHNELIVIDDFFCERQRW